MARLYRVAKRKREQAMTDQHHCCECERLKKALKRFGKHEQDCNLVINGHLSVCEDICTCGYEKALEGKGEWHEDL